MLGRLKAIHEPLEPEHRFLEVEIAVEKFIKLPPGIDLILQN
jgi:hypothetical protein